MKQLLLLAYDFPPRGASGVIRVTKFVRYLPMWGWEAHVVTINGLGPHPDPALLAELPPDLEVLRVKAPGRPAVPAAGGSGPAGGSMGWRARLKPWIVPDPQLLWVPGAIQAAEQRLRRGDIDALMTSGPPFSTHLAALWLKRRHPKLPWLMDMRDMWSEGLSQQHLLPFKLNRALEQRCMAAADHVTVVSDPIRALTIRRLDVPPAHISTITNGFDSNDRTGEPPVVAPKAGHARPLTIRYVGTIANLRAQATTGLFRALALLQHEGVGPDQLRLELLGSFGSLVHAGAAPLVATGMVGFEPFVPHSVAVERMATADVLLLVLTDDWEGRAMHTSKLFEYLQVQRPILVVGPEGEATKLVTGESVGIAAAPDDVPGLIGALRRLLVQHQAGTLGLGGTPRFGRFERRELTRQLATLLDRLVVQAATETA